MVHSGAYHLTVLLKGFDEKLKRREILEEQMKKLEAESKKIDQEIKLAMGDHKSHDLPVPVV